MKWDYGIIIGRLWYWVMALFDLWGTIGFEGASDQFVGDLSVFVWVFVFMYERRHFKVGNELDLRIVRVFW